MKRLLNDITKRSLTVIMSIVILVATCTSFDGIKAFAGDQYSIWGAPYTEKVLQDTDLIDYSPMKTTAKVSLDMARAEIETAQIVITAKEAVSSYELKVKDITNGNGDVISKNAVKVYCAMYETLGYIYNDVGYPRGCSMPDAMLPMENAISHDENKIEANNNQSIYISVETDDKQPAGQYTGTYELIVNGDKHDIPVSVNVRDVKVNTEVTSKSIFLHTWTHNLGEYDSSQRMTDLYYQMLMDYRLVGGKLTQDLADDQESVEYYASLVKKMYEYGSNEEKFGEGADRFSNFMIPVGLYTSSAAALISSYGLEIARLSCELNVDFVKRMCVYCIDEPAANKNLNGTITAHGNFIQARNDFSVALESMRASLKDEYSVTDEFIDQLVESSKNLHNIITQSYMTEYDGYIETWCPLFDSYNNELHVQKYREQNEELWWYGCIATKAPLSTYHCDDVMLSPRIESWLKAQYGVTGNLYWAVDQWAGYHVIDGLRRYRYTDDYYSEAGPYDGVTGEGYLVRPGKKYGIDGFIPTIRLDSTRDGLEEFELLETLKKVYKETGRSQGREFSAQMTIDDLLSTLASGVDINATTSKFESARKLLLDLSEFAAEGVCFTGYVDDGKGNVEYEVYVPNDVTLSVSEAIVKSTENLADGKLVKYLVNLGAATKNYVEFKLVSDDGEKSLTRSIASGIEAFTAEDYADAISGDLDMANSVLVDTSSIVGEGAGKLLRLSLKATSEYGNQYVRLTSNSFANINGESQNAVFLLYYDIDTDETLPFNIYVKFKNKKSLTTVITSTLKKGYNEFVWNNLNARDWSSGAIEYIELSFDNQAIGTVLPARPNIYLDGVTVYKATKGE